MQLTPEQLEQCRADFNKYWDAQSSDYRFKHDMFEQSIGFQAAWRPRLTVEQIEDILLHTIHATAKDIKEAAHTIHRAMGGEE